MKIPSKQANDELQELSARLRGPAVAKLLWERVLSAKEREMLGGNLESAYSKYRDSCQILRSVRKLSGPRSIIELASELEFATPKTYLRLLKEFGEAKKSRKRRSEVKPKWDVARGELSIGGTVVRRVRYPNKAKNIVKILDEFQRQGWPGRIKVPPEMSDAYTLHKAIHSLNQGLEAIDFHGDGTRKGIIWRLSVRV